jgi:hypothetical protein
MGQHLVTTLSKEQANIKRYEANAFLDTCIRKGMKFGLTFIIMKMMFTCPTLASAVSTYNKTPWFYGSDIEIPVPDDKEGQKLLQQLKDVVDEVNYGKVPKQGLYLNTWAEGLTFLSTTALFSFGIGIGLHYLNRAIREHKPKPVFVYGAFMAAVATIYACGSIPVIMPNLAALATSYIASKYLAPHINTMEDGYLKSATSFLSSSLPIVAAATAAIPLYSSAAKAAIATVGILTGSLAAQCATKWIDQITAKAPAATAVVAR